MISHEDTPPPPAHAGRIVRPIEIATIAGIIVLDQVTKFAVRSTIPLYAKRSIIPNVLPCRLGSIALQERVRVVVRAVERTAR